MYKVKKVIDGYATEAKGREVYTWGIVDAEGDVVDSGWSTKKAAQAVVDKM